MSSENNTLHELPQQRKMINEGFCFHCHYPSISGTQNAFAYYKDHKKLQNELYKSSTPIAIDTNVLQELYSISFKERTAFLKFINENAHRIIITSQVQKEYMCHRVDAIQSFIKTLKDVEGFPKKVQDALKQAFDVALNQLKSNGNRPIVSSDMVGVPDYIKDIRDFLEQNKFTDEFLTNLDTKFEPLIESVKKGVEQSLSKAVYELDDPVLAALSKTTILSELNSEEKEFLTGKYQSLLEEFNKNKLDNSRKDLYTFPGCGDRKKIKEGRDPLGDFYIYHELLSYMWHENKDVVFLTNDVTKSDWIQQNGKPFNHYIVDTYINTGHMLYIFNARDFTTLSFEAVAEVDSTEADDAIGDVKETSGESTVTSETSVGTTETPDSAITPGASEATPTEGGNDAPTETSEGVEHQPTVINPNYSYLRAISKERFLQELETAELWASSYGDGYVNRDYFIYTILGHKRFDWDSSFVVLEELLKEGLVTIVEEEHDERTIKCLKRIKQQ